MANPFLGRFYQNMERWGLPTQISFLFQRSEQLAAFTHSHDPFRRVVSDFLLEKDPLFAELNLAEDELQLYLQIYERLKPKVRKPDLVIYLAGADPYAGDRLGRLALSIDGLRRRDERVLGMCRAADVPVAVAMAGGYAQPIDDTVTIHFNTICTALRVMQMDGWR